MARIIVPEAEAIIDKEFPVLDHGFVRLVDYLGGDSRIVAAARVSHGMGTKTPKEDNALIRYLMRNMHTSPFEQVILTFHAKLPIFVARQWVRHRTARINEFSGRYSVMTDEFYMPNPEDIRRQSTTNKQGRADDTVSSELQGKVLDILKRGQAAAYASYEELLHEDIARELARINLTLSAYTQWYWQIDLHNLFHFIKLRMDKHAQYEIRQYAGVLAKMAKAVAPVAYEAFEEYSLYATTLPRSVKDRLVKLIGPMASTSPEAADILKSIEDEK
ncbi:MAG: FAD-dependent thymidylate synthase [Deltaproteobacteria bacterium]|nr:FAD-dependent thymidylate synthase [Deltaproteobacteria bacterium]